MAEEVGELLEGELRNVSGDAAEVAAAEAAGEVGEDLAKNLTADSIESATQDIEKVTTNIDKAKNLASESIRKIGKFLKSNGKTILKVAVTAGVVLTFVDAFRRKHLCYKYDDIPLKCVGELNNTGNPQSQQLGKCKETCIHQGGVLYRYGPQKHYFCGKNKHFVEINDVKCTIFTDDKCKEACKKQGGIWDDCNLFCALVVTAGAVENIENKVISLPSHVSNFFGWVKRYWWIIPVAITALIVLIFILKRELEGRGGGDGKEVIEVVPSSTE